MDVGSGRGYLGAQLAMMHKLRVLGIDSSKVGMTLPWPFGAEYPSSTVVFGEKLAQNGCFLFLQVNTDSAADRGRLVQKHWSSVLKKAENNTGGKVGKRQRKRAAAASRTEPHPQTLDSAEKDRTSEFSGLHSLFETGSKEGKTHQKLEQSEVACAERRWEFVDSHSEQNTKKETPSKVAKPTLFVPVTQFVTDETDLVQLIADCFAQSIPRADYSFDNDGSDGVEAQRVAKAEQKPGLDFLLTGLHTCGNLAPSTLRLFVANPAASVVCNVGCCYHLLREDFWLDAAGDSKGATRNFLPFSRVRKGSVQFTNTRCFNLPRQLT